VHVLLTQKCIKEINRRNSTTGLMVMAWLPVGMTIGAGLRAEEVIARPHGGASSTAQVQPGQAH